MPLYPAADVDLDSVAELVNRAYRGEEGWTHEHQFISGPRTDANRLRQDLAAAAAARLMTLRDTPDGVLLGVVWLEPATPRAWYLGMLTVRPDLQARQLGRALLASAESLAGSWGAQRVRITVLNVRSPLIAWYGRRGYRLAGEVEGFPYQDSPFGEPRRDDLAFVVLEKTLCEVAEPAAY